MMHLRDFGRETALSKLRLRGPTIRISWNLHHRLSNHQFAALVGGLLGASIFLSGTDFLTTSIAIKMGLNEGNYALIAVSQNLGLGLLTTLGISKAFFLLGCTATSVIGFKMRGRAIGYLALSVLACFVFIQLAVSLSNLSLIVA